MPRSAARRGDDEEDEWDGGESAESQDDDTIDCPHCGRSIYEDSVRCPHCEAYLSEEDRERRPARKPLWLIVGVVVCLYIVYRWIVG